MCICLSLCVIRYSPFVIFPTSLCAGLLRRFLSSRFMLRHQFVVVHGIPFLSCTAGEFFISGRPFEVAGINGFAHLFKTFVFSEHPKTTVCHCFPPYRRIAPAGFVYAQIRFVPFACFVGLIRAVRFTNLAGLSLLPICTAPKKFEWK